jgi:hypothetical protein
MCEESFNFSAAHVNGMTIAVEGYETPKPRDVALFGSIGIVLAAHDPPSAVDKFLGLR